MAINFQSALGIHADALMVRERRSEVLANNLANVDTPNFKARDLDFQQALAQARAGSSTEQAIALSQTDARHIPAAGLGNTGEDALLYRQPLQPSIDGNTVDLYTEMAAYSRNALEFEAGFRFLDGKFKGLRGALEESR